MGKKQNEKGIWTVTRDESVAETERQVERDDVLFKSLDPIFKQQEGKLNLTSIAANYNVANPGQKVVSPEEVFMDVFENYAMVYHGTGASPAEIERFKDDPDSLKNLVANREAAIKRKLQAANIPNMHVEGKYQGGKENTHSSAFRTNSIGWDEVFEHPIVQFYMKLAKTHKQESLMITFRGLAILLFITGPQAGQVVVADTAFVYPGKVQFPVDDYSIFVNPDNTESVGFTCLYDFNCVHNNIKEFIEDRNSRLQNHYEKFVTTEESISARGQSENKKQIINLRGPFGTSNYALKLQDELQKQGKKVAILGVDAIIAKVNEEVANDNASDPKGPKAGWRWSNRDNPNDPNTIRFEAINRRKPSMFNMLLKSDVDVIIMDDMHKLAVYMQDSMQATKLGHKVMSVIMNTKGLDIPETRRKAAAQLANEMGSFMPRHIDDMLSEAGQMKAKVVKVGDVEIPQYHDISAARLATQLSGVKLEKSIDALNESIAGIFSGRKSPLSSHSSRSSSVNSSPVRSEGASSSSSSDDELSGYLTI